MKRAIFYLSIWLVAVLSACTGSQSKGGGEGGDTLKMAYATRLSIVKHDGYTMVKLADPWNTGKTLHTYLLVPADRPVPNNLPYGTLIRTPLTKSVMATSVHCGLLMAMNRQQAIGGVCDLQYIHLPYVQQMCREKKIIDCGSSLSPTIEKIIDLQPDAIFLSPFQNSGGYGRLEELKIPIVETADYMETSALGRAEWMKFYGLLFGSEEKADSLFRNVERKYLQLATLAKTSKVKKSMLIDKQTGSVWYVPGGQSTIGKMISDVSVGYAWHQDVQSGSIPLPFESVLEKAGDADLWLFRYNAPTVTNLRELLTENNGYRQFKAFKNREVYGCNTATTPFYEETPFQPHLLLRDFICIAHPDLQLGKPRYFVKVNE
ncbi:MAG: ABC transporter substrate-binding protein [Prevotellaceae bacterium]|nr:ABC transporter substrate-binding protein [Prevotella sp.]MDD7257757.1 ABC transporter substrate-binding protein [Prevotellaceae bacterium]MDY6130508.1 ABC transporter substrate-binding protein [Prevotella sp.]